MQHEQKKFTTFKEINETQKLLLVSKGKFSYISSNTPLMGLKYKEGLNTPQINLLNLSILDSQASKDKFNYISSKYIIRELTPIHKRYAKKKSSATKLGHIQKFRNIQLQKTDYQLWRSRHKASGKQRLWTCVNFYRKGRGRRI